MVMYESYQIWIALQQKNGTLTLVEIMLFPRKCTIWHFLESAQYSLCHLLFLLIDVINSAEARFFMHTVS